MRSKFMLPAVPSLLAACSGLVTQNPAKLISIEAAAMHYQSARIELTSGQLVELTFKNNDMFNTTFAS